MRKILALLLLAAIAGPAPAAGLLIPKEREVPPLAMVNHKVTITIDDQIAITRVEQTFRNHTDRRLEATYVFPVPQGASVQKFSMWVNGKEVTGELIEAKKARKIYTDIVQRTQDPGLLEYMGRNLLKMRVFPIMPKQDQKVSFQYTSVVTSDQGTIDFTYPLKADGKAIQTLEKFSIDVKLSSQHAIQNIYSPSHAITTTRPDEKTAKITFEKNQALLDRNFQLYYTAGNKDVGLTALTHRPISSEKGYFMMLISPRSELAKEQHVPRDVVFVLDTSGSMRGKRIEQARGALNYCLSNLHKEDRFAVVHFATTINKYNQSWVKADEEHIAQAKKWVNRLDATGGTNINSALSAALKMRTNDKARPFTIVFFTDGRPTVGETDTKKIVQNVIKQNSANTRIFTFGVGNDVNATMLDEMSEQSRALSTFVRETENIEDKVSRLYNKISHPVLTNLQFTVGSGVNVSEVYPPELPDLFHGTQLVVIGRFDGDGHAAVKLTGNVGAKAREFVYEVDFPTKSAEEKPFVEDLWARRKVGYLLDQIRRNGQDKELVQEVVTLAKRYGITTPYTSYLIVPDGPTPVAQRKTANKSGKPQVAFNLKKTNTPPPPPPALQGNGSFRPGPGLPPGNFGRGIGQGLGGFGGGLGGLPGAGTPGGSGGGGFQGFKGNNTFDPKGKTKSPKANFGWLPDSTLPRFGSTTGTTAGDNKGGSAAKTDPSSQPAGPIPVTAFIKNVQQKKGDAGKARGYYAGQQLSQPYEGKVAGGGQDAFREAQSRLHTYNQAQEALRQNQIRMVQNGELGVNLSIVNNRLRNQSQVTNTAVRRVQNRNVLEVGGVWIDEAYEAKLTTLTVKALSEAYFRILERHPEVQDVFRLGNHLVWVTPNGTALVIDAGGGREQLSDREIDGLFVTRQARK